MSATGRKRGGEEAGPRRLADWYATPQEPVHRFLDAVEGFGPARGRWFEPSAGDGAIVRHVANWHTLRGLPPPAWRCVELRGSAEQDLRSAATLVSCGPDVEVEIADFLELEPPAEPYSVALGNPPFRLAFEFVRKLVQERWAVRVSMLLRAGFLESAARYEWLRENAPDVHVLSSRPSFVGGSTDSAMYGWMTWRPAVRQTSGKIYLLPPTVRARGRELVQAG